VVVALVIVGALAAVGTFSGARGPNLAPATIPEAQDWSKAPNAPWTIDGKPVVFFYGSVACPYCSSSSWVIWYALQQFGSWSGVTFSYSDPNDVYPNTPSAVLTNASLQSQWVAVSVAESSVATAIIVPTLGLPESAYVSTYDAGGAIPFTVINGQYVHSGSLVDPNAFRQTPGDSSTPALTIAATQGEFANQSGPAWNTSAGTIALIEAMIVESDHGLGPQSVLANPAVQQDIAQLS
jgi:hypothetical protein